MRTAVSPFYADTRSFPAACPSGCPTPSLFLGCHLDLLVVSRASRSLLSHFLSPSHTGIPLEVSWLPTYPVRLSSVVSWCSSVGDGLSRKSLRSHAGARRTSQLLNPVPPARRPRSVSSYQNSSCPLPV
jgi:hypothetical protein